MKTSQRSAYVYTCSTQNQDCHCVFVEIFNGKLSASSVLRSAPLLKLDTWEDASSFFLSNRRNPSPFIITHSFSILLQINLKTWIKGKDTLEHVFMTVNLHWAGHSNTWIPWLHAVKSHLIISMWWYIETGRKSYAFQSKKSSIKQYFLDCGLCTKSWPWL